MVSVSVAILLGFTLAARALEPPRIAKEEVRGMLGNPDVVIIDVRLGGAWDRSDLKIKGAVREDPNNLTSWMDKYPRDKTLVFYCA